MFRLCRTDKNRRFFRVTVAAVCLLTGGIFLTENKCQGEEIATIDPISSRTIAGTAAPDSKDTAADLTSVNDKDTAADFTSVNDKNTAVDAEYSDDTNAAVIPPVCGEDEYVLLSVGDNYAELYDGQGNYLSRCRACMDSTYEICTIKKKYVLDYADDTAWSVYSMPELQIIKEYPVDDYQIQISGEVFLVTDRHSGAFALYDCHGDILYESGDWTEGQEFYDEESVPDKSLQEAGYEESDSDKYSEKAGYEESMQKNIDEFSMNEYFLGRILVLDDGYLIGSIRMTDDGYFAAGNPVWVSRDGNQSRVITDEYLTEEFAEWNLQEFGNDVFVFDWNEDTGAIYNLDGNMLLGDIVSYLSTYADDEFCSVFNSGENYRISLVLREMDGMCLIYNTDLEECGIMNVPEDGYWSSRYAGGFVTGVSYRQLDGKECEGFVKYRNTCWYPYVSEENAGVIYADGEQISVPMEPGETLSTLNDAYLIKGKYVDENYSELLINRKTGETLLESEWRENGNIYFTLGSDYCIITEDKESDNGYETKIKIMDEEGKICFESENVRASGWKNGYIVLDRGIYHGIADRNGNWIIKTVNGWEE